MTTGEVFVLCQMITYVDGQKVMILREAFETVEEAKEEVDKLNQANTALLSCSIVQRTSDEDGCDTGMTLRQYLAGLGIREVEYTILKRQVKGGGYIQPVRGLIMPPGRA